MPTMAAATLAHNSTEDESIRRSYQSAREAPFPIIAGVQKRIPRRYLGSATQNEPHPTHVVVVYRAAVNPWVLLTDDAPALEGEMASDPEQSPRLVPWRLGRVERAVVVVMEHTGATVSEVAGHLVVVCTRCAARARTRASGRPKPAVVFGP
jgi:hypothetical protein